MGERMTRNSSSPGRPRNPAIDEAILKIALELFLEQGADGVNFEQLSKRTGISRATIYRRWKTRGELLNATLQSARTSTVRDPEAVMRMAPNELLSFLEDTIVAGLMSPILRKLLAQLIGALASHPGLLATYCRHTIEPGWQTLHQAIEKARLAGIIQTPHDQEILRDLLAGAIVHRLISRTGRPKVEVERAWVKRLMGQVGLSDHPLS